VQKSKILLQLLNAVKNAKKKRIHTFSSTSDYHILGKFGSDRYGISLEDKRKTELQMSYDMVAFQKLIAMIYEFQPKMRGDRYRFLAEVIEAAIEAGLLR
jgi:2-isopropylmalate synthase